MKKAALIILALLVYTVGIYFLFFYTQPNTQVLASTPAIDTVPSQTVAETPTIGVAKPVIDTTRSAKIGTRKLRPLPNRSIKLSDGSYAVAAVNAAKPTTGITVKENKSKAGIVIDKTLMVATPTTVTAGAYKSFKLSNTLKGAEIDQFLVSNGFTKNYSQKISPEIYKVLSSSAFKRGAVFVTAAGLTLTAEELLFPELSWAKRIFIAISAGLLIMGLFIWAQKKDIMS